MTRNEKALPVASGGFGAISGGWNAEHVSQYLPHTDAGFTTRTYVHLRPEDIPTPSFGSWDGPPDAPQDEAGQLVGETTPPDARLALVAAR